MRNRSNPTIIMRPWQVRQRRIAIALTVLAGLPASAAFAQTATWNQTAVGTYNWDVNTNPPWNTAAFPNSITAVANVNNNIVGDQVINLNQAITLDDLNLGDATSSGGFNNFTIAQGTSGSLIFGGASSVLTSRNGTNTVSADITMNAALSLSHTSAGGSLIVSGDIDNGGNLLTVTSSAIGTVTIDGNIGSGAGGLTTVGTNLFLNLNGNNTYTGTTTINIGTRVILGHDNALGSTAGGTIVNSGGYLNLNGRAVGAENISISGTGVSNSGAIFNGSGTAASVGGTVTLAAAATIRGSGDITLNNIDGNFTLTKNDAGKLTITNAAALARNTATADTTISGGTLRVEHANALDHGGLGLVTINSTAVLELGNAIAFDSLITAATGSTILSDGNNSTTRAISVVSGATVNFMTVGASDIFTLGDSANDVTTGSSTSFANIAGPGTVRIDNANNYIGNWRVSEGTLQIGNAAALGATAARTITLLPDAILMPRIDANTIFTANPIVLDATTTGTYYLRQNRVTSSAGLTHTLGALTIDDNQTLDVSVVTGGNITTNTPFSFVLGNVTLNGFGTFDVGMNGSSQGTLTLGSFTGANANGITKNGGGILELAGGASNVYTGLTTINNGLLALNKSGAFIGLSGNALINTGGTLRYTGASTNLIANTATVTIDGGTYDLNNIADTIGSLTYNSGTYSHGGATLTLGSNATALTLGGTVDVTGALAFTGAVNNVIAFTGASGTGTVSGNIALGTVVREFNVADGSGANDMNLSGVVSGALGGINKTNAGTLRLSGLSANTYTGLTTVSAGTLLLDKGSGAGGVNAFAGALTINGPTAIARLAQDEQIPDASILTIREGTFDLNGKTESLSSAIVLGGAAGVAANITTGTGGVLKINGGIQYQSASAPLGATVSGAGNVDLNGGVRIIEVQDSAGAAVDLTISSAIVGSAGSALTKTGAGVLLLSSNTSSFNGVTTVSAGTLQFNTIANRDGTASALGAPNSVANGTISLGAGTLQYLGSGHSTNRVINLTGAGTLDASGAGTLTLNNGGTDSITGSNQNLTLAGTGLGVINSPIATGSGTLLKSGVGTWTLGAVNTYSGSTTVSNGTLTVSSTGSLASTTVAVNDNTVLNVAGSLAAATNLTADGTANFTNASQTLATLTDSGAGTRSVTLNNTALTITGTSAFAGTISGGGSLIKSTGGTFTLSNTTNTYTGTTTLTGGTLAAPASGSLGNASATNTLIFNGGTLQATGTITSPNTRAVSLLSTGTIDTNGNTVTLQGQLSGAGSITKTGAGMLLLSGSNTYLGDTNINAGTVRVSGGNGISNSSRVVLANVAGAALELNGTNEAIGSLTGGGATGGNVDLGVAGILTVGADNTSPAAFAGNITGTAFAALTKTGTGRLTLTNANITYPGTTNINGGDLRINGTLAAAATNVEINSGGTLSGTGFVNRHVNVNSNGILSPGGSTGILNIDSATWKNLGIYQVEINDATGTEGSTVNGWDFLSIAGALDITATNTPFPSGQFRINVNSLDLTQNTGNAVNFNNSSVYQWRIASAAGGITGFASDKFFVNASGFTNNDAPNQWTVTNVGNDIFLNYLSNNPVVTVSQDIAGVRVMQNQTNRPGNVFLSNAANLQTASYSVTANSGDVVSFSPAAGNITGGSSVNVTTGWGDTTTTGPRSGSILVTNTGGNPNDPNDVVNVSGAVIANRVLTATPLGVTSVIAGTPILTNTTISSPTNTDNYFTRIGLPATSLTSGPLTIGAGSLYQYGGANDAVNSTSRTLSATFAVPGVYAGSSSFSPLAEGGLTGESVQNFSIAYNVTALSRSNGSFDVTNLDALEIDFGSFFINDAIQTQSFSIYNLATGSAALTAALDMQALDISGTGDVTRLFTDITAIDDLAAGSFLSFVASFNPNAGGPWQAVYTFNIRDNTTVLGADYNNLSHGTSALVLTLKGNVVVPEPASFSLFALGASLLLRRRRRA